jgi:hypothetical protein
MLVSLAPGVRRGDEGDAFDQSVRIGALSFISLRGGKDATMCAF